MTDQSPINLDRVDLLIQFCLAAAGQNDPDQQELGPIHIIKYVYLADMAYAERRDGKTFTGIPWVFYHFGPWSPTVYERIQPAVSAVGAHERTFESQYDDKDCYRWRLTDDQTFHSLEERLPVVLTGPVKGFVRKYFHATHDLLHFVYQTRPMLHAAPNELLDFSVCVKRLKEKEPEDIGLTARQIRKLRKLKAKIKSGEVERPRRPKMVVPPQPKVDPELYQKTIDWVDSLAGDPIEPMTGELEFNDDIWKSRARYEKDLA